MAEWVYTPGDHRLPIDRGHGVRHHDVNAARKGASGLLRNQEGDDISLWVYEVEAAFQMAGSRVQSVKQRDFYPHNFVQPAIKVRGQTANNYEYNRLSEFVRHTQKRAVFYDAHDLNRPTITFALFAGGQDTRRGQKGAHQALQLDGFIPLMARGAKRFQFEHTFEFDFVITRSVSGFMKDEAVRAQKLLTWAEVVAKPGSAGFVTDPTDDGPVVITVPPQAPGPNGEMRPT